MERPRPSRTPAKPPERDKAEPVAHYLEACIDASFDMRSVRHHSCRIRATASRFEPLTACRARSQPRFCVKRWWIGISRAINRGIGRP